MLEGDGPPSFDRDTAVLKVLAAARDGYGPPSGDLGGSDLTWAERRRETRWPTEIPATATIEGKPFDVIVEDVSVGGMRLSGLAEAQVGQAVAVEVSPNQSYVGSITWAGNLNVGLRFDRQLKPDAQLLRVRLGKHRSR